MYHLDPFYSNIYLEKDDRVLALAGGGAGHNEAEVLRGQGQHEPVGRVQRLSSPHRYVRQYISCIEKFVLKRIEQIEQYSTTVCPRNIVQFYIAIKNGQHSMESLYTIRFRLYWDDHLLLDKHQTRVEPGTS